MSAPSPAIALPARRGRVLALLGEWLWPISLLAIVALLGVTATGATVRLTASGLGCDSWPGCGGTVALPARGYHSYVEFGNRVFSVFPVVLSIALALAARQRRDLVRWARWAAYGVCGATLFQAPLGYLTVLSGLHPLMVMAHFLLTLLDIALAVVVAVEVMRLRRGDATPLRDVMRVHGAARVVVKPAVSGGSRETMRVDASTLDAGEAHLRGLVAREDVLVQPYLDSVEGHGERALVWIDGELTHAVRKSPRFIGDEESVSAAVAIAGDEAAVARAALAVAPTPLLYARIDVARDEHGAPRVMELELIEPSLFFAQGPAALARLVAAVRRQLGP